MNRVLIGYDGIAVDLDELLIIRVLMMERDFTTSDKELVEKLNIGSLRITMKNNNKYEYTLIDGLEVLDMHKNNIAKINKSEAIRLANYYTEKMNMILEAIIKAAIDSDIEVLKLQVYPNINEINFNLLYQ